MSLWLIYPQLFTKNGQTSTEEVVAESAEGSAKGTSAKKKKKKTKRRSKKSRGTTCGQNYASLNRIFKVFPSSMF